MNTDDKVIHFSGPAYDKILKKVRERNAKFAKQTLKQQRLTVARDVLSMLATGKIKAGSTYGTFGDYYREEQIKGLVRTTAWPAPSSEEFAATKAAAATDAGCLLEQVDCRACGIASMFLAAVRHADKLTAGKLVDIFEGGNRTREVKYLSKWFGTAQMMMVENYFECRPPRLFKDRTVWGSSRIVSNPSRNRRLRMIMQNIISNGGVFDPTKGRHSEPLAKPHKMSTDGS